MNGERPSELAGALVRRARERPEELAFAWGRESLRRGELLDAASRVAGGLHHEGVRPGDRVALLLPAGLPLVRAVAGAFLAGAVPLVVPPHLAPAVALRRAGRGCPALLLTEAANLPLLASSGVASPPVRALEAVAAAPGAVADPPRTDPESPLFLQQTSGSTGEPKLAVISHRAFAAWVRATADGPGLRPGDRLVGWAPPWHVMGFVRYLLLPMLEGAPCHLVEPTLRTLPEWLDTAARVGATMTSAPDSALRAATRLVASRHDLASLRLLVTGGEPVRASTIAAFERRFGLPGIVRPSYGLAEATLSATAVREGEPLAVDATGDVSCGRPLAGVELRLAGAPADDSRSGEIELRGDLLFSGYFGDSERPGPASGEWFATGDWGRLGAAGELWVVGRRRNLIKHGGATYAPGELEAAAESVAGVSAAAAISLVRAATGEAVPVVVVESAVEPPGPAAGSLADLAERVALAVRRDVGLLPGEVLVVRAGTLPRTDLGKVRHAELRARLAGAGLPDDRLLFGPDSGWGVEDLT